MKNDYSYIDGLLDANSMLGQKQVTNESDVINESVKFKEGDIVVKKSDEKGKKFRISGMSLTGWVLLVPDEADDSRYPLEGKIKISIGDLYEDYKKVNKTKNESVENKTPLKGTIMENNDYTCLDYFLPSAKKVINEDTETPAVEPSAPVVNPPAETTPAMVTDPIPSWLSDGIKYWEYQLTKLPDSKEVKAELDRLRELVGKTASVNEDNVNVDKIMDYEQGGLDATETLELFSDLLKSGLAWKLQGHYGRVAKGLIDSGYLDGKGNILKEIEESKSVDKI